MTWRKKVNNELKTKYKKLFNKIDKINFFKSPSFNYVFKWRLIQEKKLKRLQKEKILCHNQTNKKFIMFYERITKQMLKDLDKKLQIVLISLDKAID